MVTKTMAKNAKKCCDEAEITVKEKVIAVSNATKNYIHENPVKAIGISVLAGLSIAMLLKLKK